MYLPGSVDVYEGSGLVAEKTIRRVFSIIVYIFRIPIERKEPLAI